jgi:hypothetical protein
MKLYELTEEMKVVQELQDRMFEAKLALIDMETGEYSDQERADALQLEEELVKEFEREIFEQVVGKAENIAKLIINEQSEISSLKNEEKRLQEKRKRKEKQVENIQGYVKHCMIGMQSKKINTELGDFKLSESKSVEIVNADILPQEAFVVKKEPSKTAIKKLIAEAETKGEVFQGACIQVNQNINFK